MELTQEYFDQQIKQLVTKDDLEAVLLSQTDELKDYTDNQTESLARMVAIKVADPMERHFADLSNLLQIRATVERHEQEIRRLKDLLQAA